MLLFESSDFSQHDDLQLNEGEIVEIGIRLLFDLLQDLAENIG